MEKEEIETVITTPKFLRETRTSEIDRLISRLNNFLLLEHVDYQYRRVGKKIHKLEMFEYFRSIRTEQQFGMTSEELTLAQYRQEQYAQQEMLTNINQNFCQENLSVDRELSVKKLVMPTNNFEGNEYFDDLPF